MTKLTRDQLYSLEEYANIRRDYRAKVMAHKKLRRVALGEHAALYFEDRLTMQYQVQEMLRLERMFEPELIQEELDVYNPLIPDGNNWKATFMIEFTDVEERKAALAKLLGIEQMVYVQVADFEPVRPFANEDLDRTTQDKTSSVHFLRFELTPEMVAAVKSGEVIKMGIDHPQYRVITQIEDRVREALAEDLSALH